jgi:hypothetical protein
MPATINRSVLSQVDSDSGSLTSSTTVAHRFPEAGEYHGLLHIRGKDVREFTISVVKGRQEAAQSDAPEVAPQAAKVDVNLRRLHMPAPAGSNGDATLFKLEAGGYGVFHVPAGAVGGYAVEVYKGASKGSGAKVFDSRELKEGDLFAAVVLRPGTYSVANSIDGAKAELTVAYPEKMPKQLEPVKVKFAGGSIVPAKIRIHSTQGLVFSFETPSRVKIELVAPEDRPPRARAPRHPSPVGTRKKVSRMLKITPRGSISA